LDLFYLFLSGWLEPLLDPIARNPNASTTPVIASISDENFGFYEDPNLKDSDMEVGGFNWELIHTWHKFPEHEKKRRKHRADAIRSPTMIGIYIEFFSQTFFI
jgi:polypeptide N-acetylgalactosaminyltransferase